MLNLNEICDLPNKNCFRKNRKQLTAIFSHNIFSATMHTKCQTQTKHNIIRAQMESSDISVFIKTKLFDEVELIEMSTEDYEDAEKFIVEG